MRNFVVTSYTSKCGTFLSLLYCPAGWKNPIKVFLTFYSQSSRTWLCEYYHTDLHPQPGAPRQVRCVSPIWTQSCNNVKHMVAKHTATKKKQTPSLSATQQPGLLKCNFEIERDRFLLLLELFQSLHGPGPGASCRYMIMVPSTRDQKLQRRTLNYHHSLWKCICVYPCFGADVTDLFDNNDNDFNFTNSW